MSQYPWPLEYKTVGAMTLEEVRKCLGSIEERRSDPEVAHSIEDGLYHDFVKFMSRHADPDARRLAKTILTSEDIEFPRWSG